MKEQCSECKYFQSYSDCSSTGVCYYNPPSTKNDGTLRPEVNTNDFCHHFTSKVLLTVEPVEQEVNVELENVKKRIQQLVQDGYDCCEDNDEEDEFWLWLQDKLDSWEDE